MKVWKKWDDNPHIYVSEDGKIWDCEKQKMLSLSLAEGYPAFPLKVNGKHKTTRVHRIVCKIYHGESPRVKTQVRHLDGNPQNNHYTNLAWGNQLDNEKDKDRHGTRHVGSMVKNSILTEEMVSEVKRLRRIHGYGSKKLSEILNITRGNIGKIIYNINWKHVACIFISFLLMGCATTRFIDLGCTWTRTITASAKDTEETKRQIWVHDTTRAERCK